MRIRAAPSAKSSESGSANVSAGGATARRDIPPIIVMAATRSPGEKPLSAEAETTSPDTSAPGTNGSGGLNWYRPRDCRTSGNETAAALTSITTPSPGVMKCEGSGSGRSTAVSASGPDSSLICIARMPALTLHRPQIILPPG